MTGSADRGHVAEVLESGLDHVLEAFERGALGTAVTAHPGESGAVLYRRRPTGDGLDCLQPTKIVAVLHQTGE